VLDPCTRAAARSGIAETMIAHRAQRPGRDAGAHGAPGGRVHPLALAAPRDAGIDAGAARGSA